MNLGGKRGEGIKRVLQRKGDLKPGQGGAMNQKQGSEKNWKRGDKLTPRQA